MRKPTDRTVFQNAWVVKDIEIACLRWADEMGVGPFFLNEYPAGTFSDVTYRGEPADLAMKVAIAQAGPVQIELIEPIELIELRELSIRFLVAGSDCF